MNVVFSVRVFITSMIIIFLIVIPRIIGYFGLEHGILETLVAPWSTFVIIFIACLVLMWAWLRNLRYSLIILLIAVGVATGLTFYFCNLALPW